MKFFGSSQYPEGQLIYITPKSEDRLYYMYTIYIIYNTYKCSIIESIVQYKNKDMKHKLLTRNYLYWRAEQFFLVFDIVLGNLLLSGLPFFFTLFFPFHSVKTHKNSYEYSCTLTKCVAYRFIII